MRTVKIPAQLCLKNSRNRIGRETATSRHSPTTLLTRIYFWGFSAISNYFLNIVRKKRCRGKTYFVFWIPTLKLRIEKVSTLAPETINLIIISRKACDNSQSVQNCYLTECFEFLEQFIWRLVPRCELPYITINMHGIGEQRSLYSPLLPTSTIKESLTLCHPQFGRRCFHNLI